jgi:hypothetical protein
MRADRVTILAVLRDPRALAMLPEPALDLALRQLRRLKLLAHVAERLRQQGLEGVFPQCVRDQLDSACVIARARARLALWELEQIAHVLEPGPDNPVVVLKGSAYLMLALPHAAGRMLSDVDLLVPERQLARTEERLRAAGWEGAPLDPHDERYYREWTHEIPPLRHAEREMEVDVHFNILQRRARLKPRASLLLQEAQSAGAQGLAVLAPVDMVLHAMTHLFYSSEQDDALRELVDIDALLRHFAAREPDFWLRFPERARQLGLERPACYALRYSVRWLDTPVPDRVAPLLRHGAPPAASRWMMDRLVPATLFARHPDRPDHAAGLARVLLLMRAHWIRMPPWLLASHLVNKSVRRLRRRAGAAA